MHLRNSGLKRAKALFNISTLAHQVAEWRHFVVYIKNRIIQDRCIESAAALTFTSLLALVPMFTVLYAILAMVPSLKDAGDEFQNWLFQHFVPTSGEEVQVYLHEFSTQASKLTKFGVVFLFITALMMMKRIERSFNLIWRVPEPRKGVIGFMRYWAVLSLGPILLGMGLGITSYVASLKVVSSAVAQFGIQKMSLTVLPFLLSWIAFTLIYLVVPNCSVSIKRSIQGGLVAALAFECAKRGFALFVSNFGSYQMVYGAFAVLPLFLIWLYLSWIILLLGAVVTRAISVYRHHSKRIDPLLGLMEVMHIFWLAQREGRAVTDSHILKSLPMLSPEHWQEFRESLRDASFIERTDQGAYLLSKDLHEVSILDVLKACDFYSNYDASIKELLQHQALFDQVAVGQKKDATLRKVISHHETETVEFANIPASRIGWNSQLLDRMQQVSTSQAHAFQLPLAELFGQKENDRNKEASAEAAGVNLK